MIKEFVEKLEKLLDQYNIPKQEKKDIVDDYSQMLEDGQQKGLSEQAILDMVGSPEKITRELGREYKKKENLPGGEKLIALTPFISLIIFMVLGLTRDLWHPGWLVFLLIPITAILVEMGKNKDKHLLTALSPFISGILFFVVGFQYDIWHPTWLIFIIIPIFAILNSKDEMDGLTMMTALSPFISFIAFIFIGLYTGDYHLAWLVLLLVVVLGIFHEDKFKYKLMLLTSLALSVTLYLVIGLTYDNWALALLSFSIFVVTGLFSGNIMVSGLDNKVDKIIVLLSIGLFLGVGFMFSLWAISWLFLLIIPVAMIIKYEKGSHILTPLSPFFSLTVFMLLGYYFDLWNVSWLAFLLIPIVAIIEDK